MRKIQILETEIIMENQERENQEESQTQEQEALIRQTKALIVIPQSEEETVVIDAEPLRIGKRISLWLSLVILLSSVIVTHL